MIPEESTLVARAGAGDRAAMQRLYEGHRQRIYRMAWRYTGDGGEAQDIMQETFIKAFSALERGRLTDANFFSTWLYRIGINLCLDYRRRQRSDRREPLADDIAAGGGEAAGPESRLEKEEAALRLRGWLAALSPRQRMVLVLRHYQGLKLHEIAERMGCSTGSVKRQLFRSWRTMRRRAAEEEKNELPQG